MSALKLLSSFRAAAAARPFVRPCVIARLVTAAPLRGSPLNMHATYRRFASKASEGAETLRDRNKQIAIYAVATAIAVAGMSYAAVPLYQLFCQATGYGGTTQRADEETFKNMKPVEGGRQITVLFNADTSATMPWTFVPQQRAVKVVPGETALAFYTAHNPTDKAVTGVSTYNVVPARAGLYFNKIQCFCFEEQRLRPHEEIDMPVFFYIDPSFLKDPAMENVQSITLSYTFFNTGDGIEVYDIESEIRKKQASAGAAMAMVGGGMGPPAAGSLAAVSTHTGDRAPGVAAEQEAQARIRAWTAEVAAKTGVTLKAGGKQPPSGSGSGASGASAAAAAAGAAAAAVPLVPPAAPASPPAPVAPAVA